MARPPGPFTAFWQSLEVPPDFKAAKHWDALHTIAFKAFNAGRKAERELRTRGKK